MLRRTLLVFSLLSLTAFAADISGKWDFHVETDVGSGDPTFDFHQTGEKLTGTYSGQLGTAQLTGTVKGDTVEFSFEVSALDQNGKVVYKGAIGADGKMKGEVNLAGLGKGTWTGQRHTP
jgi:hypothetical protein